MFAAWVDQPDQAAVHTSTARCSSCRPSFRWSAPALAFIVMLNPTGPVNALLASVGIEGPAWFADPALGQAEPGADGAVGLRRHHCDLLGRHARRAARSSTRLRTSTASSSRQRFRHITHALPVAGDPLRHRHRDDLHLPVLHRGVRRLRLGELHPVSAPTCWAIRASRCCSTRRTSTSRASSTSRPATPRRWPGCCSWSSSCATIVFLRMSKSVGARRRVTLMASATLSRPRTAGQHTARRQAAADSSWVSREHALRHRLVAWASSCRCSSASRPPFMTQQQAGTGSLWPSPWTGQLP